MNSLHILFLVGYQLSVVAHQLRIFSGSGFCIDPGSVSGIFTGMNMCKPPMECDTNINRCVLPKKSKPLIVVTKCVKDDQIDLLQNEEARYTLELACRAPTLYCDYNTNKCVDVEPTPSVVTNNCIDPNSSFFKNKVLNENLLINCKPPTPFCDFEKNICIDEFIPYFECSRDGIFPDITNCNGSLVCDKGKVKQELCPDSTIYEFHLKTCVEGKYNCVIPNCKGRNGAYVRHPGSMNLFVLCINEFPVAMYSCPENYIFSYDQRSPCVRYCDEEGFYRDLYDENKYMECVIENNEMQGHLQHCPLNTYFDEITCTCIKREIETEITENSPARSMRRRRPNRYHKNP